MQADVRAVGSMPAGASPFGALDMAGNVREWTGDHDGALGTTVGGSWQEPDYSFDIPETYAFSMRGLA